ncbi:MAG: UvrD-helicase domain-containing protein, partial [Planctomycetota bacterium]
MREARREVVLASAGSGKTYRLSAAYLELIAHGVDPRGVLATTFTRKAAGEIAQRVLRRAVGAGTDSALASRLDEETRSVLGADGWARVAYGLARRIDSMRVRTIDGFLVSVAQGATQELGLSPGWGLLSEQEEGELRLRAVDIAIGESTREEALELLRMLHAGDPRSSVRSSVAQVASSGSAAFWAADGSPEPWHAVAEPGGALDEAALREALGVAERAALPLTGKGEPHKTWVGAARKLLEGVRAGNYAYALDS